MSELPPQDRTADPEVAISTAFPVIGIGASAGGLAAFTRFFKSLDDAPPMSFVLVQHLDPTHESSLAELLQSHTAMHVEQIAENTSVEPGHVYVIPPGKRLSLVKGHLNLSEPELPRGQRAFIDHFFRTLAEDQREQAICIILSGTGTDGSVGLKAVKESGGIVMVQDPEDADYGDMPKSALNTGLVDVVAPAEALAEWLLEIYQRQDQLVLPNTPADLPASDRATIQQILTQLRSQVDHDFSGYKRSTILRRVTRRRQIVRAENLSDYLERLRNNEQEAQALMKALLISVTNFFRDPAVFETFKENVVPELFEGKGEGDAIRVWVPGCATGEEAFSIAILLHEHASTLAAAPRIQVFASDIDEDALTFARAALYPSVISADVSLRRLERFFKKEEMGYRVKPSLRDMVLFTHHNLLRDPPFSKIDLVSCRNLLIYLNRRTQVSVFELLHYALREDGVLLLGTSETADGVRELFASVHKRHRIYRPKPVATRIVLPPQIGAPSSNRLQEQPPRKRSKKIGDLHRDYILKRYGPPSVIVDEHHEIRYLFGDVGHYLRLQEGEPTHNLLQVAPEGLRPVLRTSIAQVFKHKEAIRRTVQLAVDSVAENVTILTEQVELESPQDPLALVVFEPAPKPGEEERVAHSSNLTYDSSIVEQLERTVQRTQHRLDTVVEEYETSNEELKASNEELQSMNEELRSTTEELETSKEELQATNEELKTVNVELKSKIDQLNRANSDLENLIASTNIATCFLDRELRLMRYTPSATGLFHLIPADIGRPFAHVTHELAHHDMSERAAHVLRTLQSVEEEVKTIHGDFYLMRIQPYLTQEDRVSGVVLTFSDITDQKAAQLREKKRAERKAAVATLGQYVLEGMPVMDLMKEAIQSVTRVLDVAFGKILESKPEDNVLVLRSGSGWTVSGDSPIRVSAGTNSQAGYTLHVGEPVIVEDIGKERRFGTSSLFDDHQIVSGVSAVIRGPVRPFGVLSVHADYRRTFNDADVQFVQDVANVIGVEVERQHLETERKKAVEELRALNETLEERVAERTEQVRLLTSRLTMAEQAERRRIAQVLHDDLQQRLYAVQMKLGLVNKEVATEGTEEGNPKLTDNLAKVEEWVNDSIAITRALAVDLSPPIIDGTNLTETLQWLASHIEQLHEVKVELSVDEPVHVESQNMRVLLFRIVRELLFNAVKHSESDVVAISAQQEDEQLEVRVADEGCGFDPNVIEGNGFGLASIRERLELFGGTLAISSSPGEGTEASFRVPLTAV